MLVALHTVLKHGHEEDYLRDHQRIPDDLAEAFERLGIHNWSIWRSGRDLFHLVDCDDYAAAATALLDEPADQRWQAFIGRHVQEMVTTGEGPQGHPLPQVWTLTEQKRRDAGG